VKKSAGVYKARNKDKAEELLEDPLLEPIETRVDRFGLLRSNR
jgi:hypothetical protein